MKMTPAFLSAVAMTALVPLGCGGGGAERKAESAAIPQAPPRAVVTARVSRGAASVVQVPARIRSRQQAVISARVSALVVSMPFREGDSVRAGETLVLLDDAPQRAAVASALAQLSTAESESRRMANLLVKGAATPREKEEVEARLEDARAALASARDLLASTSLRAPFNGRIVSKSVNPGDLARPGTPLLELQGGSALELVATLEPSDLRSVRLGQRLRVRVDGVEPPVEASVHSISPAADETTHRVDVLCNLAPGPGLKPGLFARVELPLEPGGEPGPLGVPGRAVVRRGGLTGVFVVKEGRAWLRWIALGRDLEGRVEVRAGLVDGERVVVEPSGLADGSAVTEPGR
jgi:RND family efflux transporter MFP subunit